MFKALNVTAAEATPQEQIDQGCAMVEAGLRAILESQPEGRRFNRNVIAALDTLKLAKNKIAQELNLPLDLRWWK